MGKRPVVMKKAMTGFIVNRLQMAMLREAMNLVEQEAVTPEDIDLIRGGRLLRHALRCERGQPQECH